MAGNRSGLLEMGQGCLDGARTAGDKEGAARMQQELLSLANTLRNEAAGNEEMRNINTHTKSWGQVGCVL